MLPLPRFTSSPAVPSSFRVLCALAALLLLASASAASGQQLPQRDQAKLLAPTPPMGWNSWDSYSEMVTEAQVRANADWMARHLKQFGWQYVVIDEGWYLENPGAKPADLKFVMDDTGRFLPDVNRYPSAADGAGLKPLADYIHSLGLKFGIHIMRGIPRQAVVRNLHVADSPYTAKEAAIPDDTCPWNDFMYGVQATPSGQAYYNSIASLYASWGVDFIKADCISDHPYKPAEIRMLAHATSSSGRGMVLSLSPGPTAVDHAQEVSDYAEMWRISDDFWDHWGPLPDKPWSQGVRAQFDTAAKWASFHVAGRWPDADMLPFGHFPHPGDGSAARDTRLTHDEQVTLMTLWCIFRSPLIMGGDLPSSDDWTTKLLTNAEVLAVDQHSSGHRPVVTSDTAAVWTAKPEDGNGYYVAVFNLSDKEQTLAYDWPKLELPKRSYAVRDLWSSRDMGVAATLKVALRPHASMLYRVVAQP
ncbi:MAG TPA: glycoside hydrolase family 27 protein [Candidatus Angelobacter sp.]|nr:glycoside hydrolase family 27 protein [Candidatus Angelobacter sp.]